MLECARQNDSRLLSALIQYANAIIFVGPQKISIIFHYYHRHHHHHHYNFCVSKYFRFGYCWKLRRREKADISHHKSRLVCSNAPRLLCETHYTRNWIDIILSRSSPSLCFLLITSAAFCIAYFFLFFLLLKKCFSFANQTIENCIMCLYINCAMLCVLKK